jgi:hypothetical protein
MDGIATLRPLVGQLRSLVSTKRIVPVTRYDLDVGSFYTNVTLRGSGTDQVVAAIRELGYRAFVANTINGLTIVCEQQSDSQDKRLW